MGTWKNTANLEQWKPYSPTKFIIRRKNFNWSKDNVLRHVTGTREGEQYYVVTPELKERKDAFDHSLLAQSFVCFFGVCQLILIKEDQ